MKVYVKNNLPGIWTSVDDQAISSLSNTIFGCQNLRGSEHVSDQCFIHSVNFISGSDVFAGNDEDMDGSDWMNVQKCNHLVVLVNYRARAFTLNDLAEDAIRLIHG